MDLTIKDGLGKGNKMGISSDNRALTRSISLTEQQAESLKGNSYQIGSGVINLTSASESAILFLKNNEDQDLLLTGVNITSNAPTGSSGNVMLAKIYLGGSGLSSSNTTAALNNNFGSSKTLSADIEPGQEAATVTNGTLSGAFYIPVDTFFFTDIAWVLPKGSTLAITITPPASNTSHNVTVTVEGLLSKEE